MRIRRSASRQAIRVFRWQSAIRPMPTSLPRSRRRRTAWSRNGSCCRRMPHWRSAKPTRRSCRNVVCALSGQAEQKRERSAEPDPGTCFILERTVPKEEGRAAARPSILAALLTETDSGRSHPPLPDGPRRAAYTLRLPLPGFACPDSTTPRSGIESWTPCT